MTVGHRLRVSLTRAAAWRRSAGLAGAALLVAVTLTGCTGSPTPTPTYGGLPSWLPTPSTDIHRTLVGTTASPAPSVQGQSVEAHLPDGGTILMTVNGPEVPGEGLPDPPPTTICTFTIEMSGGTVDVPIDVADFATHDVSGNVFHPGFVPDRSTPPSVLQAGESISFEIRTAMPVGEGVMQWAPDGKNPVATWDFIVEND